MYCPNCGKQIEDNSATCPECGTSLQSINGNVAKKIEKPSSITAVGLVFSVMALLFGFIITTTSLALGWGIAYVEFMALIPAFVGLGIGVYKFFDKEADSATKKYALISILASGFTVFYAFIGIMVQIAP